MKDKITIGVNAQSVLTKVSRMFNGTDESVLKEMVQNARRAGATQVNLEVVEGESVTITHDGKPFEDFTALLSLGDSDWTEPETADEDPAGCGFFVSSLFETTVVESRKNDTEMYRIELNKDTLTRIGTEVDVNTLPCDLPKKDNVRITLHGAPFLTRASYEKVARDSVIPVTALFVNKKGKEDFLYYPPVLKVLDEHADDMVLFDRTMGDVRFRIVQDHEGSKYGSDEAKAFRWLCKDYRYTYLNYFGHVVRNFDNNINTWTYTITGHTKGRRRELVVTPAESSGLRMVLPARYSLVSNDAYFEMLSNIKKFLVDYVNSLGGHTLPYKMYKELGGAAVLDREAAIPLELLDMEDGEAALENPEDLESGLATALTYYTEDTEYPSLRIYTGLSEYKGYEWEKTMAKIAVEDLAIKVNNVDYDDEKVAGSGLVDDLALIMTRGDEVLELCKLPTAYRDKYREQFYGCMCPTLDLWRTDKVSAREAMKIIFDEIMEQWEGSDGAENDSWDTQQENFQEDLGGALRVFLSEGDAVRSRVSDFMSKDWGLLSGVSEVVFTWNGEEIVYRRKDDDLNNILREVVED